MLQDIVDDPVLQQVQHPRHRRALGAGGYDWPVRAAATSATIGAHRPSPRDGKPGTGWDEWNGRFRDWWRSFVRTTTAAKLNSTDGPDATSDGGFFLTGSYDWYQWNGAQAVPLGELRHRARRLHDVRPVLATTRSATTAARSTRSAATSPPAPSATKVTRRGQQPLAQLGQDAEAAEAPADAQRLRRDDDRPRHADASGRRRVDAHPARQQQRLLDPGGQRVQLVRLGHLAAAGRAPPHARLRASRSSRSARTTPTPSRPHRSTGQGAPFAWKNAQNTDSGPNWGGQDS